MLWTCEVCHINCPSDYQKSQHLEGKKHQEALNSKKRTFQELSSTFQKTQFPNCSCMIESVERKVKKEGKNIGRTFFTCPNSKCSFFQWSDTKVGLLMNSPQKKMKKGENFTLKRISKRVPVSFDHIPEDSCEFLLIDLSKEENFISLKFGYNETFMGLLKKYIKGRKWDGVTKAWLVPLVSLPLLVQLLDHLKFDISNEFRELSADIDRQDIETIVELMFKDDENEFQMKFEYEADIVNCVKELNPQSRVYNAQEQCWYISLDSLEQLNESLTNLNFIPQQERFSTFFEECKNKIQEEEMKKQLKSMEIKPESIDILSYDEENIPIKTFFKLEFDECEDCGKRKNLFGKKHYCRFFGYFECKDCSHKWTSGYSWKGETQTCKNCETENEPTRQERLIKVENQNRRNGPHDSSRCSLCQKLGSCRESE
jgi:hypothetical protein